MTEFDIYAVGLLRDLRRLRVTGEWGGLRYGLRYLGRRCRDRNWRGARGYFSGYLAEPERLSAAEWHCAGHGWTRGGAVRSFWRRNRPGGGAA